MIFLDFFEIIGHGLRGPHAFFLLLFLFFVFLVHGLSVKVEITRKKSFSYLTVMEYQEPVIFEILKKSYFNFSDSGTPRLSKLLPGS